jgi:hypothetical protein
MAFRQQLYSFIPELQDLDKTILPVMLQKNIDNITAQYSSELSNSASFEDMFNRNPGIVLNYVSALESKFLMAKMPDRNSNVSYVMSQKISILETAYSNLTQSSTQSV